jgi:predicted ABC-type ATPase
MLARLRELSQQHRSFAFESTLSGRSYATWLKRLRNDGYQFRLIYIWLRDAELAVERVAERVRSGGHAIPPDDIRRRYRRGIRNLFQLYLPVADWWALYDNSEDDKAALIATGIGTDETSIIRTQLWNQLLESKGQK